MLDLLKQVLGRSFPVRLLDVEILMWCYVCGEHVGGSVFEPHFHCPECGKVIDSHSHKDLVTQKWLCDKVDRDNWSVVVNKSMYIG